MSDSKCLRCGETRLETGTLETTGRVSFKLEHAKFLTLHTSTIAVQALLCLNCGTIDLQGDVKKALALQAK